MKGIKKLWMMLLGLGVVVIWSCKKKEEVTGAQKTQNQDSLIYRYSFEDTNGNFVINGWYLRTGLIHGQVSVYDPNNPYNPDTALVWHFCRSDTSIPSGVNVGSNHYSVMVSSLARDTAFYDWYQPNLVHIISVPPGEHFYEARVWAKRLSCAGCETDYPESYDFDRYAGLFLVYVRDGQWVFFAQDTTTRVNQWVQLRALAHVNPVDTDTFVIHLDPGQVITSSYYGQMYWDSTLFDLVELWRVK